MLQTLASTVCLLAIGDNVVLDIYLNVLTGLFLIDRLFRTFDFVLGLEFFRLSRLDLGSFRDGRVVGARAGTLERGLQ